MVRKGIVISASMASIVVALALFVAIQRPAVASDAQPSDVVAPINLTQMEQDFVQRETVYRQQLLDLESAIQERRSRYEQQVTTLMDGLAVGRSRLEELAAQEEFVRQQLVELEALRNERQSVLLNRRQEAANVYDVRYNQMAAQLAEAQAKLAEARQILGR